MQFIQEMSWKEDTQLHLASFCGTDRFFPHDDVGRIAIRRQGLAA